MIFISGAEGERITKVTGLPSGQCVVCALQSRTRSVTVRAPTALDLLETRAISRAAASEAPIMMKIQTRRKRWQSTLVLPRRTDCVGWHLAGYRERGRDAHTTAAETAALR